MKLAVDMDFYKETIPAGTPCEPATMEEQEQFLQKYRAIFSGGIPPEDILVRLAGKVRLISRVDLVPASEEALKEVLR